MKQVVGQSCEDLRNHVYIMLSMQRQYISKINAPLQWRHRQYEIYMNI